MTVAYGSLRTPTRLPARELLLGGIGLAWALSVDLPNLLNPEGDASITLGDLAVGLLMQWTGLLVWRRAGSSRTGPLLFLAGLLWFVGSGVPEPFHWTTFPFRGWYEPLLVAVVLAFPDGRLRRRTDRIVVGSLVAAFLARTAARSFVFDPHEVFDGGGWTNPTVIVSNEALWRSVEDAVIWISGLIALIVVLLCVQRWLRATGPARRTLAPVLASGLAIAPLLGWSALTTGGTTAFGLPFPEGDWITWVQFILRAIVPLAILAGIVRLHSARSALTDLLLDLDKGVPHGRLAEILRQRLGDPSLRVVFPRTASGFVDPEGHSVPAPAGGIGQTVTRLDDADGSPLAYLIHDAALGEDPNYVGAAAAAARLTLENERLQAEVRAQLEDLRQLSARLVEASDSERRRVERNLHDGAQQRLVTLALRLSLLRDRASTADPELAAMVSEASDELEGALGDLRELARGIHPAVLARSGLAVAVGALAERTTIPVTVSVPPERCLQSSEVTAYFVVAEALTNISRYAGASRAAIEAVHQDGWLVMTIADDGVGGAQVDAGTGLRGINDRVVAVGGHLDVVSPVGHGTTVRATLPCG
jgi:signal transduction histidine kinase